MAHKLRERSAAVLRGPIAVAQNRASAERSVGRPRARSTARDLDRRWLAALVVQRIAWLTTRRGTAVVASVLRPYLRSGP